MAADDSQGGVPDAFKLGKVLASQEKETRDKGVEILTQWLKNKTNPSELDYMKVWRALFYCLWMSDKPLIQHELAKRLAMLLHAPPTPKAQLLFIQSFLKTIVREWAGIDKFRYATKIIIEDLRMDKYLWLLRFFTNEYMTFLKNEEFEDEICDTMNVILLETVLNPVTGQTFHGLESHFIDIFLSEIAKVLGDEWWMYDESSVLTLFFPWLQLLGSCDHPPVVHQIVEEIFENVIYAYVRVRHAASLATGEDAKSLARQKQNFLSLLETLDEAVFELAKSHDTLERNRKALYSLHSTFQLNMAEHPAGSKKRERSNGPEESETQVKKSKQKEVEADSIDAEEAMAQTNGSKKQNAQQKDFKAAKSKESTASPSNSKQSTKTQEASPSKTKSVKESANGKKKKPIIESPSDTASDDSSKDEVYGGSMMESDEEDDEGSMDDFEGMDEETLRELLDSEDVDAMDEDGSDNGDPGSDEDRRSNTKERSRMIKMIKTPSPKGKSISPGKRKASPGSSSPNKRVSFSAQAQYQEKKHQHKPQATPTKSILKPTPAGPTVNDPAEATEINSYTEFASPYNYEPQQRVLHHPKRKSAADKRKLVKMAIQKAMKPRK